LEDTLQSGQKFNIQLSMPEVVNNEVKTITLDKEQTHIVLGYQGLRIDSNQRFTLDVLQSVLSGQGGRLFYELRDKNSLAYTVSPIRMEGLEPGYFGTYIGCSPEKKDKAISMMRDELKKLTVSLISEEELVRAQNYLVGQHAISLQKKSTICQAIVLDVIYGMSPDHLFEIIHEYKKVTREDILQLAKKLFSQPEILSIAGPVSK
jgi:zinc protease